MTIEEFLAEDGLTPEQIKAIVGDPVQSKAMSKALAKYEEGLGLSTKAQSEMEKAQAEWNRTQEFYEKTVTPGIEAASREKMQARQDAIELAARNVELAKNGWEVPPNVLEKSKQILGMAADTGGNPNPATVTRDGATGQFTRKDFENEMRTAVPTWVGLVSLSNEYQALHGEPYLNAEQDLTEAQKAGKPMRDYVRDKYKFEQKRSEKAAAAEQARIDKIVGEKLDVERKKLAQQYGVNPNTRAPMPSHFDMMQKAEDRKDSWKTSAGRQEAKKSRLARFENLQVQ